MIEEEEEEEEDRDMDEEELDRFTKTQFEGIVSYQHSYHVSELDITSTAQCQPQPCISQPPPTIIALLRCPPILIGALTAAASIIQALTSPTGALTSAT